MVESVQSLPEGQGIFSVLRRLAIVRGLTPEAKSRNTRRTTLASAWLIVRSPRTGSPTASKVVTTS